MTRNHRPPREEERIAELIAQRLIETAERVKRERVEG